MTTLAEWKKFRAKLIKAQEFELLTFGPDGSRVTEACINYGLPFNTEVFDWLCTLPKDRRLQITALFANSIAHADEQIRKLEIRK